MKTKEYTVSEAVALLKYDPHLWFTAKGIEGWFKPMPFDRGPDTAIVTSKHELKFIPSTTKLVLVEEFEEALDEFAKEFDKVVQDVTKEAKATAEEVAEASKKLAKDASKKLKRIWDILKEE